MASATTSHLKNTACKSAEKDEKNRKESKLLLCATYSPFHSTTACVHAVVSAAWK